MHVVLPAISVSLSDTIFSALLGNKTSYELCQGLKVTVYSRDILNFTQTPCALFNEAYFFPAIV